MNSNNTNSMKSSRHHDTSTAPKDLLPTKPANAPQIPPSSSTLSPATTREDPYLKVLGIPEEEIIKNQSNTILGTLGQANHGKSSLVQALSSVNPLKYEDERKRNITIKLGYANFKVWQCPFCPKPQCFSSSGSEKKTVKCQHCETACKLIRHFSFLDVPGHEMLMSTMLNGSCIMHGAFLLMASNQNIPQPQTREHLAAANIMKIPNIIPIQTKIDIINREQAILNHSQIKRFISKTKAAEHPVFPLSCTPLHKLNIDALLQYIVENVHQPDLDLSKPPLMRVVRSFDINKSGCEWAELKGGIAGGCLLQGHLKIGQELELRPGLVKRSRDPKTQKITYKVSPIRTKILSLSSENNRLQVAVPGGLIGVGTTLDPSVCKSDRLVGQVMGEPGTLADVYTTVQISTKLFATISPTLEASIPVEPLKKKEVISVNIGTKALQATVTAINKKDPTAVQLELSEPVCAELEERIAVSRKINNSWRLIGQANIKWGDSLINPSK